jgi:hypothetical protein
MEKTADTLKRDEEEKIKEEILTEEIQNEILLPGNQKELKGELKQKQWAKCVEGLARHRAIRKKQTEEEKARREQEKMVLKQKIREEMMKEKLKEEVHEELQKEFVKVTQPTPKKEEIVVGTKSSSNNVQLNLEDIEEYIQWKKSKKRKTKEIKSPVHSEESAEEDDFVPYATHDVASEEDEEDTFTRRRKISRVLPPKPKLERSVYPQTRRPALHAAAPVLYNSNPPGKYFYL